MKPRTRGEAEAEITQAVIKFEKEYLGRGPVDARTFFVNDMILIRLRGLLTTANWLKPVKGSPCLKRPAASYLNHPSQYLKK